MSFILHTQNSFYTTLGLLWILGNAKQSYLKKAPRQSVLAAAFIDFSGIKQKQFHNWKNLLILFIEREQFRFTKCCLIIVSKHKHWTLKHWKMIVRTCRDIK